jgi:hypothetical protein
VKYILALTVGLPGQGSAIAILERLPQKGQKTEEWDEDGVNTKQEWIDHHALSFLERVPSSESIPQAAARVAKMLGSPELKADADLVLDVTTYGRGLMEMFYSLEPSPAEYRIALGGETEGTNAALGGWTVPERDIRGALTLHAQEGRLKVPDTLPLGPSLLRAIENPETTPDRAIYLAAAFAVWVGRRCQTYGPWPSSKPPPRGHATWRDLEVIAESERRERRRRDRDANPWGAVYGGGGWDE